MLLCLGQGQLKSCMQDAEVRLKFPSDAAWAMAGRDFFTEWVKIYESFDQMGLHEPAAWDLCLWCFPTLFLAWKYAAAGLLQYTALRLHAVYKRSAVFHQQLGRLH